MADILLYAELYDNPLTEKEGDFTAKPKVTGTIRNADIARRIVEKRTEYRPETIENILRLADEEKAIAIAEGKSVVDGVGQYLVQIKGVFDSETEGFDSKKHALTVSYSSGKTLRKKLAETKVMTDGAAKTGPVIGKVTDSFNGNTDQTLTPGMPIVVEGGNMKITGSNEANGFFFVPATGSGSSVKASVVVGNTPSTLTVMVPANLAKGDYYVKVVTQYGRGGLLKDPRSYQYPLILTLGSEDNRPVIE